MHVHVAQMSMGRWEEREKRKGKGEKFFLKKLIDYRSSKQNLFVSHFNFFFLHLLAAIRAISS